MNDSDINEIKMTYFFLDYLLQFKQLIYTTKTFYYLFIYCILFYVNKLKFSYYHFLQVLKTAADKLHDSGSYFICSSAQNSENGVMRDTHSCV